MPDHIPLAPEVRVQIEDWTRAAKIPGCAIALTRGAGEWSTLYLGRASLDPPRAVDDATIFHLYSGTKLYTATALMRLVEAGALELDAPLGRYLPELPLAHPVTLRQLASHDAGLPDTLRAFLAVHPASRPPPRALEVLGRFRLDRGRPPGGGARYANVNYAILGALLERVRGAPYPDVVREAVLEPLGAPLRFAYAAGDLERAAVGHLSRWSPMRLALPLLLPDAAGWLSAGRRGRHIALAPFNLDTLAIGGLLGPARGFLPLLDAMLAPGDGLLRAESRQTMLTRQARGACGIVSREGVGIGWKLGASEGVTFWNHEGGGPGFCSETRLYPDAGLGVVVLMNLTQSAGLSRLCHRICELLRRGLGP